MMAFAITEMSVPNEAASQTRRDVNPSRPRVVLSVEDEKEGENLICLRRILIFKDPELDTQV